MRTLVSEKEREINQAVSRWLKAQGLSRKQAADRLGVKAMAISMQLTRHFTPKSARRWSQAFGLNEQFLLTGLGPVCDRTTSYKKMVNETETLRCIVLSQKATIKDLQLRIEELEGLLRANARA